MKTIIDRPLCILTISYILGILIGLYLNISVIFFISFYIIINFLLFIIKLKINKKLMYINLICVLIGYIYIYNTDLKYERIYENIDYLSEYEFVGTVVSEKTQEDYKDIYKIKIEYINNSKALNNTYWYLNIKTSNKLNKELQFGQEIKFFGTINEMSKQRNFKGFDYSKYLKSINIYGNIYLIDDYIILKENNVNLWKNLINKAQNSIKTQIYKLLPNDTKDLCVGMLIGIKDNISEELNEAFKTSNLTHMLAISGAHISYILIGISLSLKKIGYMKSKIFVMVILIFFMGITNYTPSVQRACIMPILCLIASIRHKQSDPYINIALSTLILLLINPYIILNIGFQLSYGGTIGIIVFNEKITKKIYEIFKIDKENKYNGLNKKILKYILDMLIITIIANIIIIPIILYYFNTISLTFWISNILAGPFLGIIVIGGYILYLLSLLFFPLAFLISKIYNVVLNVLIVIASFCSKLPFSNITVKTPYITTIIIYYILIYLVFNKKIIKEKIYEIKNNKRKMYIIIVMIIIIIFIINIFYQYINMKLKIYLVDVGQGDCILVQTPTNKNILIDGGGSSGFSSFDVGESILVPYLLDRRITTIDYMMVSHFDTDHVGGLFYCLEKLKVNNIVICKQGEISSNYLKLKEIAIEKNINIIIVEMGDRLLIDKYVYFDILFPTENLISTNVLNNNSIVAKMYYQDISILFTGDVEEIAEKQLIEIYKNTNLLDSDILKVAHHGSKSSSIQELLEYITPSIALIGIGKNNTFNHPDIGVISRLENLSCNIFRTDLYGEVELMIYNKYKIKINKKIN